MAQFDFGNLESPLSGTVFINGNLEPWRDALHSSHKGGTRPSYAVEGMMWVNDTTNPWVLNMFDGSNDIAIGTFDTTTNTFTPSGVSSTAEDISFDNTDSGLAATNVQDAIDEAVSDFSDFEGRADGFATAAQGALAEDALPESNYQVTPWVAYTPVFTGFGTVSGVEFFSRRVGDTLEVMGKFVCGISTATQARISLGFNGVEGGITSSSSKMPSSPTIVGSAARSNTQANYNIILCASGRGYFTFSNQVNGGLVEQNGSSFLNNGESYALTAQVPIAGWSA